MNIIWSEQAMEAIADTTEYIFENFGRKSSLKFMRKIEKAAAMLQSNPNIGKIESDLDDMSVTYRGFLATKINKLIYRVDERDNIYVSVFWDCRRDPETLSKLVD